jgi:hypothetical protein
MSISTGATLIRDAKKPHRTRWGPWVFRARTLTLEYISLDFPSYWIDLEDFTNSAGILDVIFQIAGKRWCSITDLGHLVRAIDHLVDPQDNVCSFGMNRRLSLEQLRRLLREQGEVSA